MEVKAIEDIFIKILRSELTETELDASVKEQLTPDVVAALYSLADRHDLVYIVLSSLHKCGLKNDDAVYSKLDQKAIMSVYRNEQIKYAFAQICDTFDQASVPYIPLKGSVIRPYYPQESMRTSCDIDILVKEENLEAAIDALGKKGFRCEERNYPINAMGITKAIEEKVAVARSRNSGNTKICCTRYGNVMCSRGSVIPLWIEQIKSGQPITLTEPSMTRFIMSLDEAVDLVLFAFEHGTNGDLLIQKAPACTIQTQAEAVCELFGGKKEDIRVIGIRHGEKMYETLLTNEECAKAVDMGNFYRVPADNRGLNYDKYFKDGDAERNTLTEFNSNNTQLLNVEQVKEKLLTLQYIRDELDAMGIRY